jgi:hypothetical protein
MWWPRIVLWKDFDNHAMYLVNVHVYPSHEMINPTYEHQCIDWVFFNCNFCYHHLEIHRTKDTLGTWGTTWEHISRPTLKPPKKGKSWGPWMLVTPSHLLHAISIFKIISHILDTSYLPKLGIVTWWGETCGGYNFVQRFCFQKYVLKSLREKKLVLNHKPIHLPCKIEKKKLDSHHKRCDYQ